MKKLLLSLSTLALLFTFCFTLFNANAEELTLDDPDTEIVDEDTYETKDAYAILEALNLSEEDAQKLADAIVGFDTTKITTALIAEFGLSAIVMLILLAIVIKFALKMAKLKIENAEMSNSCKAIVSDAIAKQESKNNEMLETMKTLLIQSNEATATKVLKASEAVDEALDKALKNIETKEA